MCTAYAYLFSIAKNLHWYFVKNNTNYFKALYTWDVRMWAVGWFWMEGGSEHLKFYAWIPKDSKLFIILSNEFDWSFSYKQKWTCLLKICLLLMILEHHSSLLFSVGITYLSFNTHISEFFFEKYFKPIFTKMHQNGPLPLINPPKFNRLHCLEAKCCQIMLNSITNACIN